MELYFKNTLFLPAHSKAALNLCSLSKAASYLTFNWAPSPSPAASPCPEPAHAKGSARGGFPLEVDAGGFHLP